LRRDNFSEDNNRLIKIKTGIKNIDSSGQMRGIWKEEKKEWVSRSGILLNFQCFNFQTYLEMA